MIICRTPFRVSFFGGGTDFPEWYNENEGKVISTTINKYCYSFLRTLPPFFKFKYKLRYYKTEQVNSISNIKHPTIKAVLKKYHKCNKGLEITHYADVPGLSGLGGSSAFTVSLIKLLNEYYDKKIENFKIGKEAIHVEQKILKEKVGSQDQISCAEGGLNLIQFKNSDIKLKKIIITKYKSNFLQNNSTLVYTGFPRKAHYIEKNKIDQLSEKKSSYENLLSLANEAIDLLKSKNDKDFISSFSKLMDENWKIKLNLSNKVSNNNINNLFDEAKKNGAITGKLLGAGGGGFALFFSKNLSEKKKLENFFKKKILMNLKFENNGSKIIFKQQDIYQ